MTKKAKRVTKESPRRPVDGEKNCLSEGHGGVMISIGVVSVKKGHKGKHMAWEEYPSRLYNGGVWK